MMMTRKDHRRSTEWEGGFKRSAGKETHAWRRSMKGKCNGLYMGTKCMMMMAVNRRWIVFFFSERIRTHWKRAICICQRGGNMMERLCGRSKYVGQLNKCPLPLPPLMASMSLSFWNWNKTYPFMPLGWCTMLWTILCVLSPLLWINRINGWIKRNGVVCVCFHNDWPW